MSLESLKTKLYIGCFSLGLASTVGVFNHNLKDYAVFALGTAMSGIFVTEVMAGQWSKSMNDGSKELEETLRKKQRETQDLTKSLGKVASDLKQLKTLNSQLEQEVKNLRNTYDGKVIELNAVLDERDKLRNNLRGIGNFSTGAAHQIVRETYHNSIKKLEGHINALASNYPECFEKVNRIWVELDELRVRYSRKIESYEKLTSFEDLLDIGLTNQEIIIAGCIELRVKAQVIICKHLEGLVKNSIPFEDYEEYINDLTQRAGERIQLEQGNTQAIAQEWVMANNSHIENYENDYQGTLNIAKTAVARIEELEALVAKLESELTEARKPLQFYGESTYANAGNAISGYYFKRYQYALDAINWEETETGYQMIFAVRRNPGLSASELYADNSREQLASFTNALAGTLPEFEFNYQNCSVVLTVQLRRAVKREVVKGDIDKIWIPASKFEATVKRWERVRITAGSTGGKSPTAKNLALAIMNSRKGVGEIRLYDPQDNSKKDFWEMPKAGRTHKDNETGIKELCEMIDDRRHGKNHKFTLFIFDELDTTIAKSGNKRDFADLINSTLKEGSHADIGVIYIGQSADANEVPGMTHSDWNNAVQLHIGSNAGIWLEKSMTISSEDKTRLRDQYRKIQEYCDGRNEELGLDIFTDATALRFALAVPLTGLPKFIQLPDFDSYDYESVMSTNTQILVNSTLLEQDKKPTFPKFLSGEYRCPDCDSTNLTFVDIPNGGNPRYRCERGHRKVRRDVQPIS